QLNFLKKPLLLN
ncbi:Protein FdhE, partial [Haemophilus influenzae]